MRVDFIAASYISSAVTGYKIGEERLNGSGVSALIFGLVTFILVFFGFYL